MRLRSDLNIGSPCCEHHEDGWKSVYISKSFNCSKVTQVASGVRCEDFVNPSLNVEPPATTWLCLAISSAQRGWVANLVGKTSPSCLSLIMFGSIFIATRHTHTRRQHYVGNPEAVYMYVKKYRLRRWKDSRNFATTSEQHVEGGTRSGYQQNTCPVDGHTRACLCRLSLGLQNPATIVLLFLSRFTKRERGKTKLRKCVMSYVEITHIKHPVYPHIYLL